MVTPRHLADSIQIIASGESLLEKANASYFAPEHFDGFPEERAVVARIRAVASGEVAPEVFVLTDDPIVYILSGQRAPVFHANMYNASPIYEQERVIKWIDATKPAFVVFEPGALNFDEFQKVVRLPLVFNAVVESYVPQEAVGRFEILRRRQLGEPIAMAYWRDKLGAETKFGHLGQLSSFEQFGACEPLSSAFCVDFLQVRLSTSPAPPRSVDVPMQIAGLQFEIVLDTIPEKHEYQLRLDRFWPWHAATVAGFSRGVVQNKLQSGVIAEVITRHVRKQVLY
jgi:hypothetical protein